MAQYNVTVWCDHEHLHEFRTPSRIGPVYGAIAGGTNSVSKHTVLSPTIATAHPVALTKLLTTSGRCSMRKRSMRASFCLCEGYGAILASCLFPLMCGAVWLNGTIVAALDGTLDAL